MADEEVKENFPNFKVEVEGEVVECDGKMRKQSDLINGILEMNEDENIPLTLTKDVWEKVMKFMTMHNYNPPKIERPL